MTTDSTRDWMTFAAQVLATVMECGLELAL